MGMYNSYEPRRRHPYICKLCGLRRDGAWKVTFETYEELRSHKDVRHQEEVRDGNQMA